MGEKKYCLGSRGFTLIELAIVLVIISLVVTGIIGGRSLIHSAQMQGIVRDVGVFKSALHTFQNQYDALPGDMRDATDYWPAAISPDGNGDGYIVSNGSTTSSLSTERDGFWEHLRLAETLDGTGDTDPEASVSQGKYSVGCKGNCDSSAGYYGRLGAYLMLDNTSGTHSSHGPSLFVAKDARFLDKKMDDGEPNKGIVFSVQGLGTPTTECVDAPFWSGNSTVTYNLEETTTSCIVLFYIIPPDY